MIRRIIKIEGEKCNGCGLCVSACHEGAIGLVDGKAKLLRDDYCDGLGDCLPICPTGAISFEEREAAEYNQQAVAENARDKQNLPCGCPSSHSKTIRRKSDSPPTPINSNINTDADKSIETHLNQWPVQIKLVPQSAPYFKDAHLLIAADCTAYSYGNFHADFMKNKITIIACPKLDDCDYSEKLTAILQLNEIKSVTIARMEVPCCGGIENAAKTALRNCQRNIPWQVVTFSTDGSYTTMTE